MWRASSRGSSMWPNITVEVERSPARCEASMISTQRSDRQLVRRDPLADAVVSTSAAVPGVEPSPHSIRYSKTDSGERPERSHM